MHIDLNVTREILIYFDCWLSIICAHLFPIPLRQHHPVDMQIEAEEKSINIQLCTFHWLFIFPSVSFSVWYGDATWSLFKWNSALTLSHNSIILLDFLFFFRDVRGRALGPWTSFHSIRFIYNQHERFLVEFSWHSLPSLSSHSTSENNFFNSQTNWHFCQVLLE